MPADLSPRMSGDFGAALLRCLPPELAHEIGIALLRRPRLGLVKSTWLDDVVPGMSTTVGHLGRLPHPVGLAAGFDKNAVALTGLARLGWSFIEVGSVTPKPQSGNPKPRIFRLREQLALVNRMGFNSDGLERVRSRLTRLNWDHGHLPIGGNVGKNRDTPAEAAVYDYVKGIESLGDLLRFLVVNISSPNTAGLRDLATPDFLGRLAAEIGGRRKTVWIKLDPDLGKRPFQELVTEIKSLDFAGVVLTNTKRVVSPQAGGLSGHPLSVVSSQFLEWAWDVHRGTLPMIASGGVLTGQDVVQKLLRGASAVEVYTAFVYRGPGVVRKILLEVRDEMHLLGVRHLADLIGAHYI